MKYGRSLRTVVAKLFKLGKGIGKNSKVVITKILTFFK